MNTTPDHMLDLDDAEEVSAMRLAQLETPAGERLQRARALWRGIELRAHPCTLDADGPIVWAMPGGSTETTAELFRSDPTGFRVLVPFRRDADEGAEYYAAHAQDVGAHRTLRSPYDGQGGALQSPDDPALDGPRAAGHGVDTLSSAPGEEKRREAQTANSAKAHAAKAGWTDERRARQAEIMRAAQAQRHAPKPSAKI